MIKVQRYLSHPEDGINICRENRLRFCSINEPYFAQKCLDEEYHWLALAEDFDKTEHF